MDESQKLPPPVTLRDILRILRRRAAVALLTFAVVVGVTLFFTSRMKTVYEATSRVFVEGSATTVTPNNILELVAGGGSSPLETEIEKIKARNFLKEIIKSANLTKETPESLKAQLTITVSGGGQILDIGVRNEKAEQAKQIADVIAVKYMALVRKEFLSKVELSEERLIKARDEAYQGKIKGDKALAAFLNRVNMSEPMIDYHGKAQQIVTVRNGLEDGEQNLRLQEQALKDNQELLKKIPSTLITGYTLVKNPVIDGYRADLAVINVDRQNALFDFAVDSDEVKAIDAKMAAKKAAITVAEKDQFSAGSRGVSRNGDYSKVQSAIHDIGLAIKSIKNSIILMRERYNKLKAAQPALLKEQEEYEGLKRERDTANEVYEQTRTGLSRMGSTRALSAPTLRLLEDAKLPDTPLSPKPLLNLAMAITLGLFLGIGMALFTGVYGLRQYA